MTETAKALAADSGDATIDEGSPDSARFTALLSSLASLDVLLQRAVALARQLFGAETPPSHFRGLFVGADEVTRLLSREPAAPNLFLADEAATLSAQAARAWPLAELQRIFGLTDFDIDVLLVALAPELDLGYQRIYAYLQDDVTRRRPTVDLVLNLLCPSAAAKFARRSHFEPGGPLVDNSILHLVAESTDSQPPLLAHALRVDEQILRLLLGGGGVAQSIRPYCSLVEPRPGISDMSLSGGLGVGLTQLAAQVTETEGSLVLYLRGRKASAARQAAEALASMLEGPLLIADLSLLASSHGRAADVARMLAREAWRLSAVLYVGEGLDELRRTVPVSVYSEVITGLTSHAGVLVISGRERWHDISRAQRLDGLIEIDVPPLGVGERRNHWRGALLAIGASINDQELDTLAQRYQLGAEQIGIAAARARAAWRWRTTRNHLDSPAPNGQDVFAAARSQSRADFHDMARRIEPAATWSDIVLSSDVRAQLEELCERVARRNRVLEEWGFSRRLSRGAGITALFTGASGTGKTMAAEIVAEQLKLDLYRIDLSQAVSKYIGETEKNLDRIFSRAEDANAILLFDEADALFGKRSEVRDAHDRYANMEVAYLLQKMEEYDGLAILATNLRENLDDAFGRRLTAIVNFPFPDASSRRLMWAGVWPPETPLAPGLDLDNLASFKLSGGNIRNAALTAAYLAASAGTVVTMTHVLQAVRREFQKIGKVMPSPVEADGVGASRDARQSA